MLVAIQRKSVTRKSSSTIVSRVLGSPNCFEVLVHGNWKVILGRFHMKMRIKLINRIRDSKSSNGHLKDESATG